ARSDDGGRSPGRANAQPLRFRLRRRDGRKHLPLRHLCPHPRRHQAGGVRTSVVGARVMTTSTQLADVARRAVLTGGLASGFLFAFHLPVRGANVPIQPPDVIDGKFAPNAFIRIDENGRTTLVMPQVEMGQGVYTSIPQIIAEELDADMAQVTLLAAPPND